MTRVTLTPKQKSEVRVYFEHALMPDGGGWKMFDGYPTLDDRINEIANCLACIFPDYNDDESPFDAQEDYYYAILAYCKYLKRSV